MLLLVLLSLGKSHKLFSVVSLAKLTVILPLTSILRCMDKNDDNVKQFVPSDISGTIQIKYCSA